jgi:hypothetical protein
MIAVTYLCSIWICLAAILLIAPAQAADTYKVGIRQIEFADTHYGDRTLAVAIFYPATVDGESQQFKFPSSPISSSTRMPYSHHPTASARW